MAFLGAWSIGQQPSGESAPASVVIRYILPLMALALLGACQTTVPLSSAMTESAPAAPPSGFVDYCARNASECSEVSEFAAAPVELDPERFEQLAEVHWTATTSIRYVSDQEQYGRKEYWTLPTDAGDCEDLVLVMRHDLIERGWPRSALRMSMAVTEKGENHLVLVVTTDSGDYVLDNRQQRVLPWSDLPYAWVKRQGPNQRAWAAL